MFAKTAILLTLLSATSLVVATPPACMIDAVNTQKNPSQIKSICQAKDVTDHMDKNCGNNKEAAMNYFAGVCKDAGIKVATSTQDSSSTSSGSSSSSSSTTSPSSSTAASSSSPAASHNTAPIARLGMDVVGLAALGVFGAMLAF